MKMGEVEAIGMLQQPRLSSAKYPQLQTGVVPPTAVVRVNVSNRQHKQSRAELAHIRDHVQRFSYRVHVMHACCCRWNKEVVTLLKNTAVGAEDVIGNLLMTFLCRSKYSTLRTERLLKMLKRLHADTHRLNQFVVTY